MAGSTEDYSRHEQRDTSPPREKRSRSPSHTHTRHKRRRHDDGEADERRSSRRSTRDSPSPPTSRRRPRRERSADSSEGPSHRRSGQSPSRDRHRHRHHHRRHTHHSRSLSPTRNPSPPAPRPRHPLPTQESTYNRDPSAPDTALEKVTEKQKPNFKRTGLLAAESNKITLPTTTGGPAHTITLKYHEPPEARKPPPSHPWTCFIFKGTAREPLATIPLSERSCWLLGREGAVADILTEHPSCSKQHAVLQFRFVGGRVRLYVIDLESGNGTWVNGGRVEGARFVECLSGDVVRFGESEREYVLLLPEG